jgi:hypothetical protein
LAHLLEVLEDERNERGIKMSMVDCRTFLPTKTFRNFVTAISVEMPEEASFEVKIRKINEQFQGINKEYIREDISTLRDAMSNEQLQPLNILKKQLEGFAEADQKSYTTNLSNIGLVKFPEEVENLIDSMELALCPVPADRAYSFGCISVGNVLTLTVTKTVTDDKIIENLVARLKNKE